MTDATPDINATLRKMLVGLDCWYVAAGGKNVGSTFSLAFGARIPRKFPSNNVAHSDEFRNYEGEANLLVWCTWRLDGIDATVTSSDDTEQNILMGLAGLVESKIVDVLVEHPGWDLRLLFSPFHQLRVFCDHVPGSPSFDGNWEMHTLNEIYSFGPGTIMGLESR